VPYSSNLTYNILGAGGDNIGQVKVVNESPTRFYYLKDHLGSIRMTVDGSGNVVGYDDYYPYGMTMTGRSLVPPNSDSRYKFTGKERDVSTGLDYFGARYYDSWRGQWGQVDPMAEKFVGWSPYNYSINNPLRFIDPKGKDIRIFTGNYDANKNPIYITYKTGMAYDGDNKFVAEIITALNGISKVSGGNDVINSLIKSKGKYDFVEGGTTENAGGNFVAAGMNTYGGIINLSNLDIQTIAHESFHAFEHESNLGGASIWSEVQAYAFAAIIGKEMGAQHFEYWGNSTSPNSPGSFFNGEMNNFIEKKDVISMWPVIYDFKEKSFMNSTNLYDKFRYQQEHQKVNLINKLFNSDK